MESLHRMILNRCADTLDQLFFLISGSCGRNKRTGLQKFLGIVPGKHLIESVCPRNEEDFRIYRIDLLQGVNGINRIGKAAAVDFHAGGIEMVVGFGGKKCHQIPALGIAYGIGRFMRRLSCRDKKNLIQLKLVPYRFCCHQMPVMDGVERPPHDSNPLGLRIIIVLHRSSSRQLNLRLFGRTI